MVLDSQMPRSGFRRSYMSTARRRRQPRWPWIAILLVAGGAVGIYSLFSGDAQPNIAHANGHREPPAQEQAASPPPQPRQQQQPPARPAPKTVQEMPSPQAIEVTRPAAPASVAASSPGKRDEMLKGMKMIEQGQVVEGRAALSKLLTGHPPLSASDEQQVRDVLTSINEDLVFSPKIAAADPLVERYVVQSGDRLARIAPRYKTTYQFLEQINRIRAENLQAGKAIKLIKGPFFAVVSKSQYRMDIYLTGADGLPIFVRSYPVGLGEDNSTPIGKWIVKKGSKTENPDWRNPRTGEYFKADDPKNPIGEYWLALEGLDDNTRDKTGYGIHGTIDPASIGRMLSLGCVRMNANDIEQVFRLLVDGESKVYIVP